MKERHKVRISFVLLLIVMCSNQQWSEGTTIVAQNDVGHEDLISLDNVTISTDLFSTCLEIGCTRNGGVFEARELESQVMLLLSLNNQSWIAVKQYTFDEDTINENVSSVIKICNTILDPFPFDVEKGETLYVCIEYEYGSEYILGDRSHRTPSLAVVVPVDIIRPWYFTIDWRVPGVLLGILLCLLVIFLKSRRGIIVVE
ncbi:MAG: hypothetical protein ACXABC_15500 [Candidatus Thorarchaeota archaeon]